MFLSIVEMIRTIPRKKVKSLRNRKGWCEAILDEESQKGHMETIELTRLNSWLS